ncbi:hypothetical protein GGX14DRAFT_575925 [Mycena pura]|uniref:Uncharacterized protein n=1 Tax=Mycena pura TaxID=153505 RepID=A0AAD6UUV7_9AGAR|nr:hypothetical protein GGX14DRAFT_575925 [Mycena pura]
MAVMRMSASISGSDVAYHLSPPLQPARLATRCPQPAARPPPASRRPAPLPFPPRRRPPPAAPHAARHRRQPPSSAPPPTRLRRPLPAPPALSRRPPAAPRLATCPIPMPTHCRIRRLRRPLPPESFAGLSSVAIMMATDDSRTCRIRTVYSHTSKAGDPPTVSYPSPSPLPTASVGGEMFFGGYRLALWRNDIARWYRRLAIRST